MIDMDEPLVDSRLGRKPVRRRTKAQAAVVSKLMVFCQPKRHTQRGKRTWRGMTRGERDHLLPRPMANYLTGHDDVLLVWVNRFARWEIERGVNLAFGALLDLCDELGLWYGNIPVEDIEGSRYWWGRVTAEAKTHGAFVIKVRKDI